MIKQMRKRILTIGLLLSMVVSLCACGGATKQKDTEKTQGNTSVVENDSSVDENDEESQEPTGATKDPESTGETETTSGTPEQDTTVKPDETEGQTTTKKPEQTTKKPEQTTKKPEQTTKKPEQTTAKPNKPTNDSNHPSNVNEKLKWTNAGWANEVVKTTSGDYIYVTNKKQTIDPVKGKGFSMGMSNFTIQEWSATDIGMYIAGNPGTIRWTSEDPSVAQVINNELVGIYAGTTKISGTCGNTTVHITVTVQRDGASYDVTLNSNLINLYPQETFQLIATERGAKYTSANSSIAKVSADGVVTGVKPGTTTVTATYNGKTSECKVIVSADDGTYMNVKTDAKYTVTKERVLLATDRTFILLDAGVVIEDNLLQNIETILTKIENVTGYSFTNTSDKIQDYFTTDRILINVSGYGNAYGSNSGVTIAPYDITIQECGAHVLVHELLHTVQHRNTVYCGEALTEGFAEYFGIQIYTDLPFSRNTYDEEYNSWINMDVAFRDITLTANNMEGYLVSSPDSHPTSYFFVKYLVEKYGEKKIYELQTAITDEFIKRVGRANGGGINDKLTGQDMFNIIKSKTSQNVAKEFYTYFSGLEKNTLSIHLDLSNHTGVYNQGFTGHRFASYYQFHGGFLTVSGPLVVDFTHAIDYAAKIFGRKCKGLNVSARIQDEYTIYGDISVTYYDANGNVVAIPEDFDYNFGSMKAVRVKVNMENAGVVRVFIDSQYTYDQLY